jgi:hypothetical protein
MNQARKDGAPPSEEDKVKISSPVTDVPRAQNRKAGALQKKTKAKIVLGR